MLRLFAMCILVFVAVPIGAEPQEHAPSVEMCRADVAVWYSREWRRIT